MATYYVRSTGGSDGNAGTSFGAAWATIQYAADTAVAGDVVLVCADGVHTPTSTINYDTNAGSYAQPVRFRGASADGTDDGTRATISGSGLGAGADLINVNLSNISLSFSDLRFTAATQHNIYIASTGGNTALSFRRCRFDSATDHGLRCDNSDGNNIFTLYNCEVDSNGGPGIGISSAARGGFKILKCSVHDNVGDGIYDSGGQYPRVIITKSAVYDNGGDGISLISAYGAEILDTTIYGNGGDGISVDTASTTGHLVFDSIVVAGNGEYGVNTNSGAMTRFHVLDDVCVYDNVLGHIDINGGVIPGALTEDPGFASVVDGAEDFTPSNVNLRMAVALQAGGTTYDYVGAIEPDDSGGGGGGVGRRPRGVVVGG